MAASPIRSIAGEWADSLLRQLAVSRDVVSRIPILLRLSEHSLKDNLEDAVGYAEESLRLSEEQRSDSWTSMSLEAVGKACHLSGRLEKAVEAHARLFDRSRSRKDSLYMLKSMTGMAAIHISLNEFLRAQNLLDAAWVIADALSIRGRPGLPGNSLLELHAAYGSALIGLGDHSNAAAHLLEGMRLTGQSASAAHSSIPLLIEYGRLLQNSGRTDSATSVYAQAYRLSRHACDAPSESASSWALGAMAESEGDLLTARSRYADASLAAERAGSAMLTERSARSLAKAYQALGIADSSLFLTRVADESRREMGERKAAQDLTLHDPIRTLQNPPTQSLFAVPGSGLILPFSAMAALFLSALIAVRLRLFSPSGQGPGTSAALQGDAHGAGLPEPVTVNPMAVQGVPHVFDGIAFKERVTGIVKNLRGCMSEIAVERQADLRKVIREMERNSDESAWQEFELRFNSNYVGFVQKLRDLVPNLTRNERRLCLFLRMDMSTKEIARLTGQSIRAIELGRIRLRKKLNLTHSESNLTDFLCSL